MTRNVGAVACLLIACYGAAARPAVPPKAAVLFFDDFSGTHLDRTSWNVVVTGRTVNDEQQAYVDSPDVLYLAHGAETDGAAGGALVIRPRFRRGFRTPEGRTFDFTSGRIDTRGKFEFTYGTMAARMKLAAGAGLWPAFWALGDGRWPETGEIDVMENVGDPAWTSSALHGPGYFGDKTPFVKRVTLGTADATAWHVYGVQWLPDRLVFSIDGRETYRVTRAMIEPRGPWAFDNPKHLIVNLALGGGYPRSVNGASMPYLGLPDATVQAIQRGDVKVLVDWVRVTRP